jgi:hypothetical protein
MVGSWECILQIWWKDLKLRTCKTIGFSLIFPSNSLMLFSHVSLFNELYCHPKIKLANYCEGSRFAWMLQKWWSICLPIFKMLQHFETFLSTFPSKCTNCIIIYVSRSSNTKNISHVTFFYPLWVPIYIYFGIWWKEVIFDRYFKILQPIYKPYDYNFKRINFKH